MSLTPACLQELPRFQGHAPPSPGADECGLQVLADQGIELPRRPAELAQLYAWGPKSGDWDGTGKWRVTWLWPWGGWTETRSSATTTAPWGSRELAAHALGLGQGPSAQWLLVPGDDPDHALLVLRHSVGTAGAQVLALEADRPPTEVRRPTGDPFADGYRPSHAGRKMRRAKLLRRWWPPSGPRNTYRPLPPCPAAQAHRRRARAWAASSSARKGGMSTGTNGSTFVLR